MAARCALTLGAVAALLLAGAPAAEAHRLAPSLLELREGEAGAVEVVWKQAQLQPRSARLRPELPAHCAPLASPRVERDAASLTLRARSDCGVAGLVGARVGVSGLEASGTSALLRIELADGRRLAAVLHAGAPALRVPARQRALDVATDYLRLGFRHILAGPDHLLFVAGLVLLVVGRRALLQAVTAFTVGHSLTLSLTALGFLGIPPALAELGIAVSILALATELVPGRSLGPIRRRAWLAAALFGLVHGLGFAGALRELGFPPGEIPLALLSFNAGIELGQLAFVAALCALRAALSASRLSAPGWLAYAPAYAMGGVAAFWCFQRAAGLLG